MSGFQDGPGTGMDPQHVLACSFPHWYPIFKAKTFKTVIIPLPQDFIDYLKADGIILPLECQGGDVDNFSDDDDEYTVPEAMAEYRDVAPSSSSSASVAAAAPRPRSSSDASHASPSSSSSSPPPPPPSFPSLTASITAAFATLKTLSLFPKLNWSAPLDARWLNGNSLKCTSATDVYTLLKGSDRVQFDLEHMLPRSSVVVDLPPPPSSPSAPLPPPAAPFSFSLVLRKYYALSLASEYRLFVRDHIPLCISQRDTSTFYPFLQDSTYRSNVSSSLLSFYDRVVSRRLLLLPCGDGSTTTTGEPLSTFVVDLYLQGSDVRVFVVDFAPWPSEPPSPSARPSAAPPSTSALLYSWEELFARGPPEEGGGGPELRVVETRTGVQSGEAGEYRAPVDAPFLSQNGGLEFLKTQCRQNKPN